MSAPLPGSPPTTITSTSDQYQSAAPKLLMALLLVFVAVSAIVALVFAGPQGGAYALAILFVEVFVMIGLLSHMICSIQPYEAGVVSVFGTYRGLLQPGFNLVSPIAFVRRVDLRTKTQDFSEDDAKTKDHARLQIKGVFYHNIVNVKEATFKVQHAQLATNALLQSELRRIVHDMNLSEILSDEGELLEAKVRDAVNDGASKWGVKVQTVEIKTLNQIERNKFEALAELPGVMNSHLPSPTGSGTDVCPYCHVPMERGSVGAESRTGGAKWHTSRSAPVQEGESVGDYTPGGVVWFDGYRCRTCGKLILQG